MATRNLKKVLRKIYSQNKNLEPNKYPISWNKAVKYVQAKDYRLSFNAVFKPLFSELYTKAVAAYVDGGHILTWDIKKELKSNAKAEAKEITKAKLASKIAPEQSGPEQETVQS